ncbi:hypothetical protein RHSIM_Rhsim10G0017600 [Rhododendron simsii]|uniref:Uncharacterized protein n=1 Tax=Rhododendron simsii TaxID=118357 RepID=A0A834GE22_RHOSS|nr:hypothetical protein RHSIM_Rhsim10G0017600 [Rhododendron simsii]
MANPSAKAAGLPVEIVDYDPKAVDVDVKRAFPFRNMMLATLHGYYRLVALLSASYILEPEILRACGKTVWGNPTDIGKVLEGAVCDAVLDNNGKDLDVVGLVDFDSENMSYILNSLPPGFACGNAVWYSLLF